MVCNGYLIWLLAHCERLIPEQSNLLSRLCRAKGHVIEGRKKCGNLLDVFATAHWKAVFAIGRSGHAPCRVALLVMDIKSLEDFLNSLLDRL
jgi:hypothetical protein